MSEKKTYTVVIGGTAYDRIGFLETGSKTITLLYSRDRRTVIVNYLVIVALSGLPEFLEEVYGAEFAGVQPRAIAEDDIAAITVASTEYGITDGGNWE